MEGSRTRSEVVATTSARGTHDGLQEEPPVPPKRPAGAPDATTSRSRPDVVASRCAPGTSRAPQEESKTPPSAPGDPQDATTSDCGWRSWSALGAPRDLVACPWPQLGPFRASLGRPASAALRAAGISVAPALLTLRGGAATPPTCTLPLSLGAGLYVLAPLETSSTFRTTLSQALGVILYVLVSPGTSSQNRTLI